MVEGSNGKKNTALSGFYVTELRLLDELCANRLECLGIALPVVHGGHLFSLAASGPVVKHSGYHPHRQV